MLAEGATLQSLSSSNATPAYLDGFSMSPQATVPRRYKIRSILYGALSRNVVSARVSRNYQLTPNGTAQRYGELKR